MGSIVGPLVGSLYVQSHFSDEDKSAAENMTKEIRNTFSDMLKNLDWMDDTTKEKAVDKARAMKEYVGYPDDLLNMNKLSDHFSELEIGEDYFQNRLNMNTFDMKYSFSRFRYDPFSDLIGSLVLSLIKTRSRLIG